MRTYPAKILVYGEYSVLDGGSAFAMPLPHFSAVWGRDITRIDDSLWQLYKYLHQQNLKEINLDAFYLDIHRHSTLTTSIPFGSGLGSSGSVAAAIYDRYRTIQGQEIEKALSILQIIEGFYHGQSSGMDPLVIWKNQPIVKLADQYISLGPRDIGPYQMFLIDSQKKRNAKPLIRTYLQWAPELRKSHKFLQDQVVDAVYSGRDWIPGWEAISDFQWSQMRDFIPDSIANIWKRSSSHFSLKFCGAGGGGYFLGITKKPDLVTQTISLPIIWI